MLVKNFWKVSFIFLIACQGDGPPDVTVNQLDTVNNIVNPFKITKYNDVACKIETQSLPSYPILGPEMHGAFCFNKADSAKIKAYIEADCLNRRDERNRIQSLNRSGGIAAPKNHGATL